MIRRTTMVRVECGGSHYVVALAGESDWARNVRAAGGCVVIGGRQRRAARLAEVPPQQRAPIIRAYLLRWGRRAGSRAVAREARYYFGVSADASLAEIQAVAGHYRCSGSSMPVMRAPDRWRSPRACTAWKRGGG